MTSPSAGHTVPNVGISAFASYLPSYRVSLESWCQWTGDTWDKVRQVVGSGFRMGAANENAATMAATAVLRLIRQHNIDPSRVKFLGLGTESSTDNSAGAVVVKGMVNEGLARYGLPALSRACEVPEFKHACLGGVYAMKAAARFLAADGRDDLAIVVCADIAEYAQGSSGEATQGAGAVAMLLEAEPKLLTLQLHLAGSASDYRGVDFRKPLNRFARQTASKFGQLNDFPVFNGKYSTTCYIDEVLAAMRQLFTRIEERPSHFMQRMAGVFLHRPYQRMAETGLIMSYLLALALGTPEDLSELASYANSADVDPQPLQAELLDARQLTSPAAMQSVNQERFPLAVQTARSFRSSPRFAQLQTQLGDSCMQQVGNLYTASLPAWLAAGVEQAATDKLPLANRQILAIGYGSGDAAEAIPLAFVPGWEQAAAKTGFAASLATSESLSQQSYQALHEKQPGAMQLPTAASMDGVFYIDHVGDGRGHIDDLGIEYYGLTG